MVNLVIQRSSNEELFRSDKTFMNKLNMVLVQIVKQARRLAEACRTTLPCEHAGGVLSLRPPCRSRSGRMPGPRSSLTSSRRARPTSRFAKTTWRCAPPARPWGPASHPNPTPRPLGPACIARAQILKLLSEEVFDFSRDEMTSAKAKKLKESFNADFSLIFQVAPLVSSQ